MTIAYHSESGHGEQDGVRESPLGLKHSHRSIEALLIRHFNQVLGHLVHVRGYLFLVPETDSYMCSIYLDASHISNRSDAGAELREVLAGSAGGGEGVIVSILITSPEEPAAVVQPHWRIIVETGEVVNHEGLAVIETLFHFQFNLIHITQEKSYKIITYQALLLL